MAATWSAEQYMLHGMLGARLRTEATPYIYTSAANN